MISITYDTIEAIIHAVGNPVTINNQYATIVQSCNIADITTTCHVQFAIVNPSNLLVLAALLVIGQHPLVLVRLVARGAAVRLLGILGHGGGGRLLSGGEGEVLVAG